MKKRLIALCAAVAALAVLICVYFAATKVKQGGDKLGEESTESTTSLLQSFVGEKIARIDAVDSYKLVNSKGTLSVHRKGDEYEIEGFEKVKTSQDVLKSIADLFTGISSVRTIEENAADLSKYGIGEISPYGEAIGKDGKETVRLGDISTDGKYRYFVLDDKQDVYIMSATGAGYLEYGIDDVIDKTVAKISKERITYCDIKQKGKDEILIEYDADNAVVKNYADTSGLAALVMKKPMENMIVYPYNLQNELLGNVLSVKPGAFVTADPSNLADYGLAEPELTVELKDGAGGELYLEAGSSVKIENTDQTYVRFDGRSEIFLMETRLLEPFKNAEAKDFIQPFIALHTRSDVENILLAYGDEKYTVEFKTEGDNKIAPDEEGVVRDKRNTYINGTKVERSEFTDFYEAVVGLSFDDIVAPVPVSGDLKASIVYTLSDNSVDRVEFYDYDANFFRVKKGEDTSILVSKQDVKQLIEYAKKLA